VVLPAPLNPVNHKVNPEYFMLISYCLLFE
jgi:hypothetical protein